MAYEIDFTDATGTTGFAHKEMLLRIQALAELNGWVTLRYDTTNPASHELILRGEGLSGTEEIFVGFQCYHDVVLDYYNIAFATFIGYVPEATFASQPGVRISGVPAHNTLIDYTLQLDAQLISVVMLVGAGVCETGVVGKPLAYTMPSAWSNALVCGGMLTGASATRYSDIVHDFWCRGNNARFGLRVPTGVWTTPEIYPYCNPFLAGASLQGRPTDAGYSLYPLEFTDAANVYGYIPGWYQVTGFDNTLLQVAQRGGSYVVDEVGKTTKEVVDEIIDVAGGRAFVVIRAVVRTGFNDYAALEMR